MKRHPSRSLIALLALSVSLVTVACDADLGTDTPIPISAVADPSPADPSPTDDVPVSPATHEAGDSACHDVEGQGPWTHDLEEWTSTDGETFTYVRTFQVCADVPSVAQSSSGRLVATYQAFEEKSDDTRWDKIAARVSDNEGETWSTQAFITIDGLPEGTGRAFDPTITYDPSGQVWRLYFSLTTNEKNQLDDDVCTHSATSTDGVDYTYESGTRFCAEGRPVIDPAVTLMNGTWFYAAPSGAPQDGAYFATSKDGINFTEGGAIPSDNNHNWTGNFVGHDGVLRFYGAEGLYPQGNYLWYAESTDQGASWSDFARTNIPAGKDPAAIRLNDGTWRVYVPTRVD